MRPGSVAYALIVAILGACRPVSAVQETIAPPAEAYARPSDFAGEWLGESAGSMGVMTIKRLGERRYYGSFESDDKMVRYVANMTQETGSSGGAEVAANVLTFTWQDGRGGVGNGWLMINEEDSALTGEIVYGDARSGGPLAYVRLDE